tara:strand:- start:187 stop:450 length:264 start_codon:yes stop_codon:yes gene_type:complete
MSKKYIYSEKKIIREFLGSLLSKIIVNRHSKIVQNLIKTDPIIAKYDREIVQLGKQFERDIERKRKKNPNYDDEIEQLYQRVQSMKK